MLASFTSSTPLVGHAIRASAKKRGNGGYTLVELMVVISIIAILASVVVSGSWQYIRNKSELITCHNNMRTLHVALSNYIQDNDGWPQMSDSEMTNLGDDENDMWKWWYERLKRYDISKKHFLCATDDRERGKHSDENPREDFESSYIFPFYEPGEGAPFEYNQPWILERGGFHDGKGNQELMPGGDIRTSPFSLD